MCYTKGMIPTIVKASINSVDFKVISKVEKEKNILNRSTWEIRRSMEKISCFLTLNHTHLSQPYIKSIDFLRDEGENKQNMLIFVSGCSTPLRWMAVNFGSKIKYFQANFLKIVFLDLEIVCNSHTFSENCLDLEWFNLLIVVGFSKSSTLSIRFCGDLEWLTMLIFGWNSNIFHTFWKIYCKLSGFGILPLFFIYFGWIWNVLTVDFGWNSKIFHTFFT